MTLANTTKHITATLMTLALSTSAALADDDHRRGRPRESVEVSDHFVFNTDRMLDGATILVRDFRYRVVTATVTSRDLDPDTAYSIWWAVFNYPRFCAVPYRCTVADLKGDPRVRPSVFWGGGFVSDATGVANTSMRLTTGRTTREIFAGGDYGLRNLRGAEIHVVGRRHGPTGIAGPVADQVGTANLACPPEKCQNVWASIHSSR